MTTPMEIIGLVGAGFLIFIVGALAIERELRKRKFQAGQSVMIVRGFDVLAGTIDHRRDDLYMVAMQVDGKRHLLACNAEDVFATSLEASHAAHNRLLMHKHGMA